MSVDGLLLADAFEAIREADEGWWSEQDSECPEHPRRWSREYFDKMLPILEDYADASWRRPNLIQLEELRLRECNELSDIDCLQVFSQLKYIDLSVTGITSAAALSDLDHLEFVDLRGCENLHPPDLRCKFDGVEACNLLRHSLKTTTTTGQ